MKSWAICRLSSSLGGCAIYHHMHRVIKSYSHQLRYAARIVALRLVDLRLQTPPSYAASGHRPPASPPQPAREKLSGKEKSLYLAFGRLSSAFCSSTMPNKVSLVSKELEHINSRLSYATSRRAKLRICGLLVQWFVPE
jgi:hypothetical protein